jgi:hypothetical protein
VSRQPSNPVPEKPIDFKLHDVGDLVDVYCDHEQDGSRIRDWLQGVVVQADPKMVAVQFVQNVYLTDAWMVPDRVLWFQQGSEHVRPAKRRRRSIPARSRRRKG